MKELKEIRDVFENKKNLYMMAGALAAVLLLVFLLWLWMNDAGRLMEQYLAAEDYESAARLFNDRIAGRGSAGKHRKVLLTRVDEIVEKWQAGRKTYSAAMSELGALKEIDDERLQSECQKQMDYITLEENGERSLRQAEEALADRKYDKAFEAIARVSIDCSYYEAAKELAARCKSGVLEDIGAPNSVGAYENAIGMLQRCFAASGDIDLSKRQRELEQEFEVYRAVSAILEEAADLFDGEKYGDAFFVLTAGLEQYPEDPHLSEALQDYTDHYVIKITKEAEALALAEAHDKAIDLLDEAIEVYDCQEFRELRTQIKWENSIWHQVGNFFQKKPIV